MFKAVLLSLSLLSTLAHGSNEKKYSCYGGDQFSTGLPVFYGSLSSKPTLLGTLANKDVFVSVREEGDMSAWGEVEVIEVSLKNKVDSTYQNVEGLASSGVRYSDNQIWVHCSP